MSIVATGHMGREGALAGSKSEDLPMLVLFNTFRGMSVLIEVDIFFVVFSSLNGSLAQWVLHCKIAE